MATVKALAQSPNLKSRPSDFAHLKDQEKSIETNLEVNNIIPVIDVSLLSSTNPDDRAKAIHDLGKACEEWGSFMVVNHEIPEMLTNQLFDACNEFFNLSEEEKHQFDKIKNNMRFPMMVGSGFAGSNPANGKGLWRDYMRCYVHPEFSCPDKPKQLK
ncbi:OLC1v1035123C1 [Oldenlandia corymbosa var. corymbosa]|uniref:OLC1v1035123C1 n=1 Tax=Oldenlandia corymbosa var. corymbosa TaxID=529605 RepID=A0AAV1CVH8_OLDCO|nr:OLC1v1035123C1 [Oldenlandia corymbosa var. corymbosa]